MHPLVKLAKDTIELYVRERKVLNMRDEHLLAIAPRIGFPVLIKATAGGGAEKA